MTTKETLQVLTNVGLQLLPAKTKLVIIADTDKDAFGVCRSNLSGQELETLLEAVAAGVKAENEVLSEQADKIALEADKNQNQ